VFRDGTLEFQLIVTIVIKTPPLTYAIDASAFPNYKMSVVFEG